MAEKKQTKKKTERKSNVQDMSIEPVVEESEKKEVKKQIRLRGKRYVSARAMVDRTKTFMPAKAVELLKKVQYAKSQSTVEAHLVLREEGISVDVAFPHTTGKSVRVAVADDALLKKLEAGVIEFDILLAKPDMMPKLTKFARVLGPKGLMPNPKNGTITPTPEKRQKELEGGKTTVRSEKKAPLVHLVLGKTSQPEKELTANLEALLKAMPAGSLLKCVIASSMGPGIKVDLSFL